MITGIAAPANNRLFSALKVVEMARRADDKQLQRTVISRRGRGARASSHCASAARFMRQRAAAELRR
jgi:hypothetical protein